jgi:phage-related protein
MTGKEKPLEWIGSSHRDLMRLPTDVRRFFGYALSLAQAGDQHDKQAVFVPHCFQKKSKRGTATPKGDLDIIRARLKVAEALAKELRNEKTAD